MKPNQTKKVFPGRGTWQQACKTECGGGIGHLLGLLVLLCLWGCINETNVAYHRTDHPEEGKITTLTTTWDGRGAGVGIPDAYTLRTTHATSGDFHTATLSGAVNSIDHLMPEGQHAIHIYSTASGVTVSGTKATANYAAGEIGWFFSGVENLEVEKDKEYELTVAMHQRVRELRLSLELRGNAREHITKIEASLSGVAGAIHIETGEPTGNVVTVAPVFTLNGGVCSAAIRLLGTTGNTQQLTLVISYDDGTHEVLVEEMHELLKDFNGRVNPLNLEASLELTAVVIEPRRVLGITVPTFTPLLEGYARPDAKALTIYNSGNRTATISAVSVSPETAFEIGGSGSTVAAGQGINTWTIRPKAGLPANAYIAYVTVTYDGTEATTVTAPVTFSVTLPPAAILSVTAPVFWPVLTGYARPEARAMIISNRGDGDATITSVSISPETAFEIGGSGSTVAAERSINTWTVRPKAGLTAGTYTATITVTFTGGEQPTETATANVGFSVDVSEPLLSAVPPVFADTYVDAPQPAAQPLVITNSGNGAATITSVTVPSTAAFEIGGSGSTVAANRSINTWTVRPKADLAAGTYTDTVTVSYDGGRKATARLSIIVHITQTRILNVTPPAFTAVNPGYVQPAAQPIVIANSGNSTVTVSSVTVSSSAFVIAGSGSTIAAGQSISTWTVRPAASLPAGAHTAIITVTYDGTEATTVTAIVNFVVGDPAAGFAATISGWTVNPGTGMAD